MRTLHFRHSGFSKLSETFIYDFVTELERQGVDNHVVARERLNADDRPIEKFQAYLRPGRWDPVRLWWNGLCRAGLVAKDELERAVIGRGVSRLVGRIAPDVIHAHFGVGGYYLGPIAKKRRIPLVVSFYGYDISQLPREELWRRRYLGLWGEAAAVVVLSENMRSMAVGLGCPADKIHVVHLARAMSDGPPPDRRHPIRRFISVGRLVDKKGHEDAVRAFARACRNHPGLSFDIVGDGPLQGRIESLIRELEMNAQIRAWGALPNSEVLRMLREADAFILCSKTAPNGDEEGTPTVLVEAQLLGLPCVATVHAGIPEMIPVENHWLLAPEGEVTAIASRMDSLMNQPRSGLEEIAARGWRHARQHFDLATETRKLIGVYQSVMK